MSRTLGDLTALTDLLDHYAAAMGGVYELAIRSDEAGDTQWCAWVEWAQDHGQVSTHVRRSARAYAPNEAMVQLLAALDADQPDEMMEARSALNETLRQEEQVTAQLASWRQAGAS